MKKKAASIYVLAIVVLTAFCGGGYATWNLADPAKTCGQCHEIKPTHYAWTQSAHSQISCIECHGTAMSNGIHSIKEKLAMVFTHFVEDKKNSDIRLTEEQLLDVMTRCAKCHQSEFAKWESGAHATRYENIYLDKKHNLMEKPYWDCLRCHGMFYGGNIHDLMDLNGKPDDWKLRDPAQAKLPSIPCMACHEIHTPNKTLGKFDSCYARGDGAERNPKTSLYVRAQKNHLRTDKLTPIEMYLGSAPVKISRDPNAVLCQQCHSPNWKREAHSDDDFTPTGVHEGVSCIACHDPHSNSAKDSCVKCHSAESKNCKKDVRVLDTSYLSKSSKNDVHKMTCTSCHAAKQKK